MSQVAIAVVAWTQPQCLTISEIKKYFSLHHLHLVTVWPFFLQNNCCLTDTMCKPPNTSYLQVQLYTKFCVVSSSFYIWHAITLSVTRHDNMYYSYSCMNDYRKKWTYLYHPFKTLLSRYTGVQHSCHCSTISVGVTPHVGFQLLQEDFINSLDGSCWGWRYALLDRNWNCVVADFS